MKLNKTSLVILFIFCISTLQSQPKVWNIESMQNAKSMTPEAVKLLIGDAEKELNKNILTVVDKPMTPPSGDKHDYMSMGRYWWPNPKFNDGLPYIRKDGVSNPEIEKLDRYPLSQMTRGVKLLSLAYYFTQDDKYAAKAVDHLRKWFLDKATKMNPNLNYGQTVPGYNNGMGRGAGIIDTYSFMDIIDGVELLKSSNKLTKKDLQGLQDWFSAYLDWMLTSPIGKEEFGAKNNHGTAYDIQVVRFALFVGKEDIARKYLNEFPVRRLYVQIEPNGSQPQELARTTAFGYSVFNLNHILDLCYIAKNLGIDLYDVSSKDERSITKAIEFLLPFIDKSVQDFPYQQISGWESVQQNFALLLYRTDNLNNTKKYLKYYKNYLKQNVKNSNLLIY